VQVNGWKIVSTINICIVFLIFGLTLETSELKEALKSVKAWVMGLLTILVFTALTAFIFVHMGFQPVEFGIGLAIFACSPTSLSQVRWVIGSVQWRGQDQGHVVRCANVKPPEFMSHQCQCCVVWVMLSLNSACCCCNISCSRTGTWLLVCCALQSITIVIQSYGNAALALLYTVASNLLSIIISPLFVTLTLGPAGEINKVRTGRTA
jgi:predicted Na+-dependent transporter